MKGCTVIYVVIHHILAGYIILSDTIRAESKKMIDELTKLKVQPVLLTGDHKMQQLTLQDSFISKKYMPIVCRNIN